MTKKTSSGRPLFVRLKTSRGRTTSSQKWLLRQLNDPYIQKAKVAGYRSRAAYKLIEINEKFKILKPGARVVDLGAAPGGWTQVILEQIGPKGRIVGVDLTPMEPLNGAHLICGDFCNPQIIEELKETLSGSANVVLS
ncbi:MAG TPA: RlmE family RNA methyltransferase, partial [Alphaproteobacteria bacterium]|nr:RlmE family RNA methyltransferase [Alphaproteobacteria bacterium]